MQNFFSTLALLVGGLALIALTVWSWRGASTRARWWHRDTHGSDSMAMGVFPGVGLIAVAVAALRVSPDGLRPIPIALIVVGALIVVIGAVVPRLWGPPWYRDYLAKQKRIARARKRR